MTSVNIKYTGPKVDIADRPANSICNIFAPGGSYIDTPAYEGTCYDTNVHGWGKLNGLRPMANTVTRFAWLERAAIAAVEASKKATTAEEFTKLNVGVTFDLGNDYMEKLYWMQMADNVASQGFVITVTDNGEDTEEGIEEDIVEGDPNAATMSVQMPAVFKVGEAAEFSLSILAGDAAGTLVVGSADVDTSKVEKFEYLEVQDGNWYELVGDTFGPAAGFPMMDATSNFRVTFKEAGTTEATFYIKSVADGTVLAQTTAVFKSRANI